MEMNTDTLKPLKDSVTITESNLPMGVVFKNKHLINNINFWHKFVISNAENLTRDEVLRAILNHVHPLDLIPVAFYKDNNDSSFLARNCGSAIQKFCNDNLVVPNPIHQSTPLKLKIILKFSTTAEFKVGVQKNIIAVLTKRYNIAKRTLNLNNFDADPDLSEFCPMSQPKIMFFILHLSKNLLPPPERYILSNNYIKLLKPLDALSSNAHVILALDLRNNLIEETKSLLPLKLFKLNEIVLDGNPICDKYDVEKYVYEVKRFCHHLEKLDEIPVKIGSFPVFRDTYLCNLDGLDLVDQFLEFYFVQYDSRNRRSIECLYDTNAMFSLNSQYYPGQLSSQSTSLWKYNNLSRNLLKLADFSRNMQYLFKGSSEIINALCNLPQTEHDPFSFKIDMLNYTTTGVILSVSGVFRETPENLLDTEQKFGFHRIFGLAIRKGNECYIVNDMLHIYNAFTPQVLNSFKISKPIVQVQEKLPHSETDQKQIVEVLKTITKLNSEWSKKCLDECNYDLKKTLMLFVDLYKGDRIPKEAFLSVKK